MKYPWNAAPGARQFELYALVFLQILQRLWLAGALQVRRCRHQYQLCVFQFPRDQIRISRCTSAYGQVVSFFGKINIAVADMDFDLHVGIALAKFRQQGQ
ncbi:hypothetical protein D3C81_1533680 [compost metagenome]